MIPTSVLIKLATLGLSKEQAEAVGTMLSEVETATKEVSEAAIEKSREKARARLQKWKDNQAGNVSKRSETSRNAGNGSRAGDARGEDNLQTKNQAGQEEKKDRPQAAPTPRSELETVLDANRAAAVVEHRQKLRKPLTAHAARLLASKFAKAPDPNAAADMMVENGWQGFEPSWLEDRTRARPATAPPGKRNFADVAMDRMRNGANGAEGIFGGHGDAELIPPGKRQSGPDDDHIRGGVAGRYLPSNH